MIRALAALALLAGCQPAYGATYGPPAPVETAVPEEVAEIAPEAITQASRRDRHRRAAHKWEIAFQVLNAADAVQTIVHCGNIPANQRCELNPLYGNHPSAGKVVGIKAAGGLFQYLIFRKLVKDNPSAALRYAQVSVLVQGTVVGLNLRTMF